MPHRSALPDSLPKSAPASRTDSDLCRRVRTALQPLVIGSAALDFAHSLANASNGIVVAEPGAGKTTGIPLALMCADWLSTRSDPGIVVVEPRRVAARQAAVRMADMLGEQLSTKQRGRVGLRSRDETLVGNETLIEVVTDGVLPRMLRSDPSLAGRSVIIFDEFHERSLDTDLGLALALSAQALLRPDLVVIIMSATLDTDRVAALLEVHSAGATVRLHSPGRAFPVAISNVTGAGDLAGRVTDAAVAAVLQRPGDVLVFLPGIHEINLCARRLREHPRLAAATVLSLHARGNPAETAHALRPSVPGEQRIVLATSLAQTSVTIDGVTTVIDSGFVKVPQREPNTGLTRLATTRISKATAVQRAGRAGRTAPGYAVQLWSNSEWLRFDEIDEPAIQSADLTGLALAAADWGVPPTAMAWTDPPDDAAWRTAQDELSMLGALDEDGAITARGRAMAAVPTVPRIASLLTDQRHLRTAAVLAAYLSDSDWFATGAPLDLRARLAALTDPKSVDAQSVNAGAHRRFERSVARFTTERSAGGDGDSLDGDEIAVLALRAFPERLAVRSESSGERFCFANGLVLPLERSDRADTASIVGAQIIVAIELDGDRRRGAIRVAVPVTVLQVIAWASTASGCATKTVVNAKWAGDRLEAFTETELTTPVGALTLLRRQATPDAESIVSAVRELTNRNPEAIQWSEAAKELWARIQLAGLSGNATERLHWTDLVVQWVTDMTPSTKRAFSVGSIDLHAALRHHLDLSGTGRELERKAPTSITIGERSHRVHYATDSGRPTIRTRVQDMFGTTQTPTVCGQERVTIELLSPAGRVVGVTDDIGRFWTVGYPGLRADQRGRYPKHHWPEDPTAALPRRVNTRSD